MPVNEKKQDAPFKRAAAGASAVWQLCPVHSGGVPATSGERVTALYVREGSPKGRPNQSGTAIFRLCALARRFFVFTGAEWMINWDLSNTSRLHARSVRKVFAELFSKSDSSAPAGARRFFLLTEDACVFVSSAPRVAKKSGKRLSGCTDGCFCERFFSAFSLGKEGAREKAIKKRAP